MPKVKKKKSYAKVMRDLVASSHTTKLLSDTRALGGGAFKKIDKI
tara:strand:- start:270 stop:404 length:135 start_codon:yes stop_codon:yes gene_type:complete